MSSPLLSVRVAAFRQLTPRVREYLLEAADGQALPAWSAGAHVELHATFSSGMPLVRHYSLVGRSAAASGARNAYRIAVQREDRARGSAFIHEHFEVGTQLHVSYPHNNFPLDRTDAKSLLIAGGIGITPIVAMLRSLVQRHREFEVVYAGRSLQEMAYREDVLELAGGRARLHARPEQLDIRALLSEQPAGTNVYVCGPRPMVDATHEAAGHLGWEPQRVRSELFVSSADGTECSFDVELRRSGQVVRVAPETTILDALRGSGVQPLFHCRQGECGLCATEVLEADGPIRHADRYLSEEERTHQLCICVSRLKGSRIVLDA